MSSQRPRTVRRLPAVQRGDPHRVAAANCGRLRLSCEDQLVVETDNNRIRRIRKVLIELLLTRAPGAKVIKDLALEYKADPNRFKKDTTFCILCGICVRYCNEIKRLGAVGFIGRGASREVTFIPE